jgi:hypothetical protein
MSSLRHFASVSVLVVGSPLLMGEPQPLKNQLSPTCIPRAQCCRICTEGPACGNWCTKAIFNCQKTPGCACDAGRVCRN